MCQTRLTVEAPSDKVPQTHSVHPFCTQSCRIARNDGSQDHGHSLPQILLARFPSAELGNEVGAVFSRLFKLVENDTRVGIVVDTEAHQRAAERREEGLEEDQRDGVVRVVCSHSGDWGGYW